MTAQIAIEPPDASLGDFDWRISMANVESDGPFSTFANTDRSLGILRGNGVHLFIAQDPPVPVTRSSDPVSFPGDTVVRSALIDGTVTDLNVMTRRDRLRHTMRRLALRGETEFAGEARVTVLVCVDGSVEVRTHAQCVQLGALDSMRMDEPARLRMIPTDASTLVYAIEILSNDRSMSPS